MSDLHEVPGNDAVTAGWKRTGHGVLCLTAAENKGFQIFSPYVVYAISDEIHFDL